LSTLYITKQEEIVMKEREKINPSCCNN